MEQASGNVNVRTVSILTNMVFFVVGFNYSFFTSLVPPLVSRSLTYQYGAIYAEENLAKFSGVLLLANSICGAIANPKFGQLSDRFGRRAIMLISLSSATICLFSFASFKLYWVLLAVRMVTGLLDSSQFMAKVVIGDIVTPETQKTLFSWLYSWFALCLTTGPFLVSIFENTGGWTSSGHCLIAGSIAFACLIANYAFLPETKPQGKQQSRSNLSWYMVLSTAKLAIPIWSYGILSMCLAAGEFCTALFIRKGGGGLELIEANVGHLFAIQGVAYCLTQALFSSPLLRRYGNVLMFRLTLAAMVVLYPLAILAAHVHFKFVTIAIVMCARVFASSIAVSAINLIINETGVEADALGSVAAVAQSMCGFLKSISLFAFGVIYDILRRHQAAYVSFHLIAVLFALLLAFSFEIRRNSSSIQLPDAEFQLVNKAQSTTSDGTV